MMMINDIHLCEAPVLSDGCVAVVQRAGHAANRHAAGAVGRDARRLRCGRAAARPSTGALAARPEPATITNTFIYFVIIHLCYSRN